MAKQLRGEATVERLLTAALEVYAAGGQPGFTVNAVTAASGVSLGSLYHHFGSFDGLATELYVRCMEEQYDGMLAALRRTRTARTGVRALVTAYLGYAERNPDAGRFLHGSAYSSYLGVHAERIRSAKAAKFAEIAAWMRPRIAAGEIAELPAPLIEVLLIGPVAVAAHRWLAGPQDMDLPRAVRVLPDRIWRSLQPD
ncbi:TetR/AcrR family transcriptional regulator [Kitasatospora sp. NPDC048365]|uniref:TetR/AcrR family transcriptional regulator n=1 Tax=Kitasatospora sp. NPDC048365 TaxID=3364050 RepID=UPI00371DAB5B